LLDASCWLLVVKPNQQPAPSTQHQAPSTQIMTYFLEHIAESLYKEFGNTLNRHCLVFPNRRAGLYFLKYLAKRIEKPVWSPSILTINELFRSYSTLQVAGNEILLFELYRIYSSLKKPAESFDEFYYWGDMLLNDFDDVDKYMVDASLLFRNVLDIKNIDSQFGGLTEYQIEIIKRFWTNFNSEKPTGQKSGFLSIWSVLTALYNDFRNSLKKKNLGYEGMIFREFTENASKICISEDRWDLIHFIGFNALNECEKSLMTNFKKAGKARFYWDYDNSYLDEVKLNSAGYFLRENLKKFGNDMPGGWSYDTMLSKNATEVQRRVIDTSSDVAQVKLVPQLLERIPDINMENAHHTAVVLADENLLMPVLTSLPENMGDINITMGHPLKQTLVYILLKHLMDLQRNSDISEGNPRFGYKDVISILKHPLLFDIAGEQEKELLKEIISTNLTRIPASQFSKTGILTTVFTLALTPSDLSDYFKDILSLIAAKIERKERSQDINIINEYIYRVVLSINRLETIVKSTDVSLTTSTYMIILDRMLRMQSVPFSGEPLSGIQIMGILETRTLDFKNLIILSVNEGILPAVSAGSSFIPFALREAFGLPSVNHQESIYAYHFYRLLQRAEDVTLIYNSNSEGLRSGEMSRFILQMKYNELLRPDFLDLNFSITTSVQHNEILVRTDEHSKRLAALFLDQSKGRSLSPSALNTWLSCRMKFFFRYIDRLKEPDTVSADIDPAMLGNILHEIMKNIYQPYTNATVSNELLTSIMRNDELLSSTINKGVNDKYKAGRHDSASGNELIIGEVLMAYLKKILNSDKTITPFSILKLEDSFAFEMPFMLNGTGTKILTGGKVDRIDKVSGVTRIVDYKTGTVSESINSIDDLFLEDRKKDHDGWLQTLLYCEAYLSTNPGSIVRPSVYKIRKLNNTGSSDNLRIRTKGSIEVVIEDYTTVREEFLEDLGELIRTIFNNDEPFKKTKDLRGKCSFCPYSILCGR
jgi:hypothetical protein